MRMNFDGNRRDFPPTVHLFIKKGEPAYRKVQETKKGKKSK
jgi:hypothetical protein